MVEKVPSRDWQERYRTWADHLLAGTAVSGGSCRSSWSSRGSTASFCAAALCWHHKVSCNAVSGPLPLCLSLSRVI